jgi:hypothetical protein
MWTAWRHFFFSWRAVRFMRGNLFLVCHQWAAIISSVSILFSVTISEQFVPSLCGILQSKMYFCFKTHVKYGFARKCRRKFRDERVPSRQKIYKLVNKLKSTRRIINKKQKKYKRRVLTEDKLDDIGARPEHIPRKSLNHLAQEIIMSKSSARRTTQLLKLIPYKTTIIHARLAAARPSYQGLFLLLVTTTVCRRR